MHMMLRCSGPKHKGKRKVPWEGDAHHEAPLPDLHGWSANEEGLPDVIFVVDLSNDKASHSNAVKWCLDRAACWFQEGAGRSFMRKLLRELKALTPA